MTVQTTMMALDDCSAGPGSCKGNCGTACNNNAYQMSYPHYTECSGHSCTANTNAPAAGSGCGTGGVLLGNGCTGHLANPHLQDCGPPGGQAGHDGYCFEQSYNLHGCVYSKSFAYLCGGCNPMTYGLITLNYTPNG